ncbi:MAG: hypothetical protein E7218_06235 [Anaerofustis stercorihominis]|nr:hypothetical protein [Anaerofustis stercorihominis]
MYVYAEEIFMVNFIMDYMLAHFVCSIKNHRKTKLKCFICALIGGVYGVSSLYIHMGIQHKIITCFAMGYIIDKSCVYETVISSVLMLLGSFICAGSITALSYLCSSQYISSADIDYIIVFFGSVAGLYIFDKCILTINKSADIKDNIIRAKISMCHICTYIYLLNDSGNLLRTTDGKSVIIVDKSVFSALCPDVDVEIVSDDIKRVREALPEELQKRAGIITAEGITGKYNMLLLKIDNVKLYVDTGTEISPAYVAFAHIDDERFSGIINMNLISKEASK